MKDLTSFIGSVFNITYNGGCMVACGIRMHTLSSHGKANRKQGL